MDGTIVPGGRMLESELHKLLEGTADAAFVVDGQGVTRSWNRAAERLLGYQASEVIGKPCAALLEGRGALGTPVCREECDVLGCVSSGCEIPNFDLDIRTRSGERLWVNVSILQFHDIRTRRHLAVHLMRDIGERKKSEELHEKLLRAAKDMVSLSGDPARHAPVSPLTDQEQRVLKCFGAGRSPAEVARELKITDRTLRNHLYHINQKLQTNNRLEAVIHATRRGLI
ncbi:MAG TPA: PAS domain S-box protein [Bryobacterales bacterium]|nr:PAS domain S-box protein [Bryobacterales bacterium]